MENKISISFWGDCKIDDISCINFDNEVLDVLHNCDLNVVNFEAPIKSNGCKIIKSGPNLDQSPDTAELLKKVGFNVFSLANNHIMDYGVEGLNKTIEAFRNLTYVGAGIQHDAYEVKQVAVNGYKIGFISLTHCEFGTLYDDNSNSVGAAWICSPKVNSIIKDSKANVDYLFVLAHAGIEYMDIPLPEWRCIYKSFIDLGADGVIASHPHVPQGWEVYKNKLIMYSLGNFCFQDRKKINKPYWFTSLCCILHIDNKEISFEIKPISSKSGQITIDNNTATLEHISLLNDYLRDKELYDELLVKYCKFFYKQYLNGLSAGGYVYIGNIVHYIKRFVDVVLFNNKINSLTMLNIMRCDSHRWLFLRAFSLFNK